MRQVTEESVLALVGMNWEARFGFAE
uniref:Uncharacterized protein n=1 Tax=Arundo donax TaxID=35708 RepID=A0A0A8Z4P2_ARUDO